MYGPWRRHELPTPAQNYGVVSKWRQVRRPCVRKNSPNRSGEGNACHTCIEVDLGNRLSTIRNPLRDRSRSHRQSRNPGKCTPEVAINARLIDGKNELTLPV